MTLDHISTQDSQSLKLIAYITIGIRLNIDCCFLLLQITGWFPSNILKNQKSTLSFVESEMLILLYSILVNKVICLHNQ